MSDTARIEDLYRRLERLRAELKAVETGLLPFMEVNDDVLAEDVASEFGISPQTANNRLMALVRVGLAGRERIDPKRGGKRFAYRVLPSSGETSSR